MFYSFIKQKKAIIGHFIDTYTFLQPVFIFKGGYHANHNCSH